MHTVMTMPYLKKITQVKNKNFLMNFSYLLYCAPFSLQGNCPSRIKIFQLFKHGYILVRKIFIKIHFTLIHIFRYSSSKCEAFQAHI
jgi:hypothetical protein